MGKNPTRRPGKLKAGTLLESVIAMGLMAAALSFAVGLHFRILTSDKTADQIQAWALSEELLARRLNETNIEYHEPSSLSSTLEVQVNEHVHLPGLTRFTMTFTRGNRTILTRHCLIPDRS